MKRNIIQNSPIRLPNHVIYVKRRSFPLLMNNISTATSQKDLRNCFINKEKAKEHNTKIMIENSIHISKNLSSENLKKIANNKVIMDKNTLAFQDSNLNLRGNKNPRKIKISKLKINLKSPFNHRFSSVEDSLPTINIKNLVNYSSLSSKYLFQQVRQMKRKKDFSNEFTNQFGEKILERFNPFDPAPKLNILFNKINQKINAIFTERKSKKVYNIKNSMYISLEKTMPFLVGNCFHL